MIGLSTSIRSVGERRRFLIVCFGLIACNPLKVSNDSSLQENENPSDIWVSAANPGSSADVYELLVSTPHDYDSLIICEHTDADQCSASERQYQSVTKLNINQPRSFFLVSGFELKNGMDIAMKAANSGGTSVKRSVKIAPPGENPFSSGSDADATNGAGGTLGQIVNNGTYTYGNLSSQYRYWAPTQSADKAVPLVVYLHGDTGSNYGPPSLNPQKIVDQQNGEVFWYYGNQNQPTLDMARTESANEPLWNELMFLAILAPLDNGSFTTWSSFGNNQRLSRQRQGAEYVHNLVQNEIFPKFNIDKRSIFFVGQSGGGVFLTTALIPLYGNEYRGGGIALCGGQPPLFDFSPSETFKKFFKLHFQTTGGELRHNVAGYSEDFYEIIPVAQKRYQTLIGNESYVTLTDEGQDEHCHFEANGQKVSQPTLIAPIIKRMMRENGVQ